MQCCTGSISTQAPGFASDTAALARWLPGAVISQRPVPGPLARAMLKGWSRLSIREPGRTHWQLPVLAETDKRQEWKQAKGRHAGSQGAAPSNPALPICTCTAHLGHAGPLVGWLAVFYVWCSLRNIPKRISIPHRVALRAGHGSGQWVGMSCTIDDCDRRTCRHRFLLPDSHRCHLFSVFSLLLQGERREEGTDGRREGNEGGHKRRCSEPS